MDHKSNPNPRSPENGVDEIGIVQLFFILLNYKLWIIACTTVIFVIGILYAWLASPVYHSVAIIALKETGKGNDASRIFSQLGGMGGMVASQLGLGNTSLDKIEVILKGHELADSVIRRNDLLPVLYPDLWNGRKKSWITENPNMIPTLRQGIQMLRGRILSVSLDGKKGLIRVGASFRDSSLAKRLVDFYLIELNNKIRNDAMKDAETNREYLEIQLNNTTDPILVQKIQSMVGFEIEKYMLVSSRAVEILDPPVVPTERAKPKRKMIVILAFIVGLVISATSVFLWRGFTALKNPLGSSPNTLN